MPQNPVIDIKGSGALRAKTSLAAGPADEFSSNIVINDDGILHQLSNYGTRVYAVKGDGRVNVPIDLAVPTSIAPGDIYLYRLLGVDYLVYIDSAGVPQLLAPGAAPLPAPTLIPLNPLPATNTLTSVVVDTVGVQYWSLVYYNTTLGYRHAFSVQAGHDGTSLADATTTQLNMVGGVAVGLFDVTTTLTLTGVGPAQLMNLVATTISAGWSAALVAERMTAP